MHKYVPQISRVAHLNSKRDNIQPTRGGIILYTIYNDVLYFGLAIDNETHDLTDAGGAIEYITDETAVRGCIREFSEETLNIFEDITVNDILDCPVVYDKNNMIIFMHVSDNPNDISYKLSEKYRAIIEERNNRNNSGKRSPGRMPSIPEVCGITWLTKEIFDASLKKPGVIYSRVRKFLSSCSLIDLYNLL